MMDEKLSINFNNFEAVCVKIDFNLKGIRIDFCYHFRNYLHIVRLFSQFLNDLSEIHDKVDEV